MPLNNVYNTIKSIFGSSKARPNMQATRVTQHRKKSDTTPITKDMYSTIQTEHSYWKGNNRRASDGNYYHTQDEFAVFLNSKLNLDKSKSVYSRIFLGRTVIESCRD